MANKKKVRKIKKTKGKKNLIEATFTTKKDVYANNIIASQQKLQLFKQSRLEDIKNELKKYGIDIDKETVLKKYKTHFQIDDVTNEYNLTYQKQLDDLNDLNLLFDEDCIILYVKKIVEESFAVNEMPIPSYIANAFIEVNKLDDTQKPEYFLKTLKTMNQMKNHTEERNFATLFKETVLNFDAEGYFNNLVGESIHNCFPDLKTAQAISNEIFQILEDYEFEYPEYIYSDTLGLLAMHGYSVVEEKFKKGLLLYPNNQIKMYIGILLELEFYYKKHDEKSPVKELYEQAILIKPLSEMEEMDLEVIKENYKEYIKKIN